MKKIVLGIFALFLILIIINHFFIPRIIIEIKNPIIQKLKNLNFDSSIDFTSEKTPGYEFEFNAFDGTKISAYRIAGRPEQNLTVILLHGIRSNKKSYLELSKSLSQKGITTIAIDSRAHGKSGGSYCTFGVKEKKDISSLIDYLEKQGLVHGKIGVWGKSLGGAIGLQAMGTDARIDFGIIESTFSDFETITKDYFQFHLNIQSERLTNYWIKRAGEIGNFNTKESQPKKYCTAIHQPILIVHGTLDKRINIRYGKENFKAIKSKNKRFISIAGANHSNVMEIGGKNYFNQVVDFILQNAKP